MIDSCERIDINRYSHVYKVYIGQAIIESML